MYIHLGQDVVVGTKSIIGIFDIDTCSVSKATKGYLQKAQRKKEVTTVSQELPKAFIVTEKQGTKHVYITQISTATLQKRADFIENLK